MKQYKYRKLRGRIIEKYGTFSAFAKAIKLSKVTVSNKMTGNTGFSQDDIYKWSNILDIPVEEYGSYFFT